MSAGLAQANARDCRVGPCRSWAPSPGSSGHSFKSGMEVGWLRAASGSGSVRPIGLLFLGSFFSLPLSDPSAMCPFFSGEPQSWLSVGVVVSSPSSLVGGSIEVSDGTGVMFPVAFASSGPRDPYIVEGESIVASGCRGGSAL